MDLVFVLFSLTLEIVPLHDEVGRPVVRNLGLHEVIVKEKLLRFQLQVVNQAEFGEVDAEATDLALLLGDEQEEFGFVFGAVDLFLGGGAEDAEVYERGAVHQVTGGVVGIQLQVVAAAFAVHINQVKARPVLLRHRG